MGKSINNNVLMMRQWPAVGFQWRPPSQLLRRQRQRQPFTSLDMLTLTLVLICFLMGDQVPVNASSISSSESSSFSSVEELSSPTSSSSSFPSSLALSSPSSPPALEPGPRIQPMTIESEETIPEFATPSVPINDPIDSVVPLPVSSQANSDHNIDHAGRGQLGDVSPLLTGPQSSSSSSPSTRSLVDQIPMGVSIENLTDWPSIELEAGDLKPATFLCRYKGRWSDLQKSLPPLPQTTIATTIEPISFPVETENESESTLPTTSDSVINELTANDNWRSLGLGWEINEVDQHMDGRLSITFFGLNTGSLRADNESLIVLVSNLTLMHIGQIHGRIFTCRFGAESVDMPVTVNLLDDLRLCTHNDQCASRICRPYKLNTNEPYRGVRCLPQLDLGEKCQYQIQCEKRIPHSHCGRNDTCQCSSAAVYVPAINSCARKSMLGEDCRYDEQCNYPIHYEAYCVREFHETLPRLNYSVHSVSQIGTCRCKYPFVPDRKGGCVLIKGKCTRDEHRGSMSVRCINHECDCQAPYVKHGAFCVLPAYQYGDSSRSHTMDNITVLAVAISCVAFTLIVGVVVATIKLLRRGHHQGRASSQEEDICGRSIGPPELPPPFCQAVAPHHPSNDDFFREYVPSWWNSRGQRPFLPNSTSVASSVLTLPMDVPLERPPSYEQVLRESDPNMLATLRVSQMPNGIESAADAPITLLPSENVALRNDHFNPEHMNDIQPESQITLDNHDHNQNEIITTSQTDEKP